jgi:hypothetical protein
MLLAGAIRELYCHPDAATEGGLKREAFRSMAPAAALAEVGPIRFALQ